MLIAFGMICVAYYLVICAVLKKWDSTFSRFWLAAGILFAIGQMALNAGGIVSAVVRIGFTGALLMVLATELLILRGMSAGKEERYDYLIVLGAQVKGRKITDSLYRRLVRAKRYLEENPGTVVIVSGGRGKGEEISEADAMAEFLVSCGILPGRIIKEGQSRTTKENLVYSGRYLDPQTDKVGIVSNNFHLYRACCYARKLGYQKVSPVAAGCHPVLLVNYLVRECFAVWKMWVFSG